MEIEADPYPAPSETEPCSLCFESIAEGRGAGWDNPSNSYTVAVIPCLHWFCASCLEEYAVQGGRTCPMCRADWSEFLVSRYLNEFESESDVDDDNVVTWHLD